MKKACLLPILLILFLSFAIYLGLSRQSDKSLPSDSSNNSQNQPPPTKEQSELVPPIAEFKPRITKKTFGTYVTPQNSPVSPERFTGYHTAVDVEYGDVAGDVPIYAINDGQIVLSKIASGYGGVFILQTTIQGQAHSVLYGHIRPSTLPQADNIVKRGDQLGLLGTGYTSETDNERKHLHFAILSNDRINLLGYVQTKTELSGWLNPTSFFP